MTEKHLINSIYRATEGEGVFVGRPQIFVRYQGCAIGCINCDSKDTWEFDKEKGIDVRLALDVVQCVLANNADVIVLFSQEPAYFFLCPERDSNSYILTNATPSRWCVYQFRHPGSFYTK